MPKCVYCKKDYDIHKGLTLVMKDEKSDGFLRQKKGLLNLQNNNSLKIVLIQQ
jgi:hypothetical protein